MKRFLMCLLAVMLFIGSADAKTKSKTTPGRVYVAKLMRVFDAVNPHEKRFFKNVDKYETLKNIHDERVTNAIREGRDPSYVNNWLNRWAPSEKEWMASIIGYRAQIKKLRSISPVPQSLRETDDAYVTFSLQVDRTLDNYTAWLRGKGSYNVAIASAKKAVDLQTRATDIFGKAANRSNGKKKYTDG